jgi:hypothetical protein
VSGAYILNFHKHYPLNYQSQAATWLFRYCGGIVLEMTAQVNHRIRQVIWLIRQVNKGLRQIEGSFMQVRGFPEKRYLKKISVWSLYSEFSSVIPIKLPEPGCQLAFSLLRYCLRDDDAGES